MQEHHPLESTNNSSEENGLQQVDTSYIHEDHGRMDLKIQNFAEFFFFFDCRWRTIWYSLHHNKVTQLYVYIYPLLLFSFKILSPCRPI